MKKLYTSKSFLKTTGGGIDTSHLSPLDPPLAISCGKESGYFNHSAPLILFFFTKRQSQKGRAMAQCPPKCALAFADVLFCTDIQRRAVAKGKNRLWLD